MSMGPSRLRVSSGTEPPAFLDLSAFVPNSSEWPSSRDRPREQCWSAGLLALAGLVHEVGGLPLLFPLGLVRFELQIHA